MWRFNSPTTSGWPLVRAALDYSTRRRTPPKRLAAARASAPPLPAARAHQPPAQRWPPAVSGSRALGQQARVLAEVRSRRRAPRQPAAASTRHARARSVRRPARSAGAPAAEHAAALWQLCCRIGTTTTVACQVVGSRARYHRVQTATMAGRGEKAGTARRARGGGRAHPAIRHRVCIRTRSGVRRLTILIPIGAAFGHGTRTHTLSRTLTGREASKCAVRPQSAARAEHLSRAPGEQSTTTGTPPRCLFSFWRLGPRTTFKIEAVVHDLVVALVSSVTKGCSRHGFALATR